MSKHFMGFENKIIVATKFDEAFANLKKDAEAIAGRTGMSLKFVHAIESASGSTSNRALANIPKIQNIFEAVEESRQLKAEQRLKELIGSDDAGISVLSGDTVGAIIAESVVSRAALIMVSANSDTYKFVPKGFSTALRLMAYSDIPVLVSPRSGVYNLKKDRIKMLIADDLSDECQDVVISAFDVARALGRTDVLHLHTCTLADDQIKGWIDDLSPENRDIRGTADISLAIRKNQESALTSRAPERIPLLEARGCTYRNEVVSGDALDQITRAADKYEADIIVFGRHKTIHKKTFSIGKVPFYAMLQQNRLIMIVPPRYQN